MEKQLNEWIDNTLAWYNEQGKNCGMSFYIQTPLTRISENPEIIIMGINPGSDGVFKEEITREVFIQGNPYWNQRFKWAYVQRIQRLLMPTLRENAEKWFADDNKLFYTNASFFSSKKANGIEKFINSSIPKTMELISILRPKLLICLSGTENFKRIKSSLKGSQTVQFRSEHLYASIYSGCYNGIKVIGIPHPSAFINNDYRRLISIVIKLAYENSTMPYSDFVKLLKERISIEIKSLNIMGQTKPKDSVRIAKKVNRILSDELKKQYNVITEEKDNDLKWIRIQLTDTFYLSIVSQAGNNQFIGISTQKHPREEVFARYGYQIPDELKVKLKDNGWKEKDQWFFIKAFNDFIIDYDTEDTLVELLSQKIYEECNLILSYFHLKATMNNDKKAFYQELLHLIEHHDDFMDKVVALIRESPNETELVNALKSMFAVNNEFSKKLLSLTINELTSITPQYLYRKLSNK